MIVIDTSIWIEFLKHNHQYFPEVKNLLEKQRVLAVECIFGELLQSAKNKRERELLVHYWENLPKCSDKNIWIEAGIFSSENKLFSKGVGLIDCAIIISARKSSSQVWSLDKKLNSLLGREEKYSF